jgi:DNA-binding CsgD family transcriptional regulator
LTALGWKDLTQAQRDSIARLVTDKELDALKLSLDGAGYKRIAAALDISPDTARDRVQRARRKLDQIRRSAA